MPPAYVKPFVTRHKNDAVDAEAISEAALRPTMRFVLVKSEETQSAVMVFRICELLILQRTQVINALRGHLPVTDLIRLFIFEWLGAPWRVLLLFGSGHDLLP